MIPIQQIHPLVVHFPIVFFLSLTALDLYARLKNVPIDGRGAIANLSAGLAVLAGITAIIAFIFGDMALEFAVAAGASESLTEMHETLGSTTAVLLAIWGTIRAFAWYRKIALDTTKTSVIVVIELLLTALIITTAYYGGQLVYDFGINVTLRTGG